MPRGMSRESEYLELIYNLHSICEALIHDGFESADAMLMQRLNLIKSLNGGTISVVDGLILVTSLNRCIYDFFQFYMHISFTACCYRCRVNARQTNGDENIIRSARTVLKEYEAAYIQSRELSGYLDRARSYIRSHLSEELTLETVGKAVHVSEGYLSHIFSSLAGQTFVSYVRDERMALARQLLNGTELSIDEAAAQCGFSSPNYFATVFKKYMGTTPLRYRKNRSTNGLYDSQGQQFRRRSPKRV